MNLSLKKLESVILFSNGNIVVFDEQGKQVPELQVPPICLWADHVRKLGYDPKTPIEIQGGGKLTLFETEFGWNWHIEK